LAHRNPGRASERFRLPDGIVTELRDHLAEFVALEPTALVFTGPKGAPIRRGNFNPWWDG